MKNGSEADVLYFFFEFQPEAIENARFQTGDDFAELPRGAAAGVVNQVGVVIGDTDAAVLHPFCTDLLEEVGGRDLSFADDAVWHMAANRIGQIGQEQILEDTPGAR